jgi:hypothetical protein
MLGVVSLSNHMAQGGLREGSAQRIIQKFSEIETLRFVQGDTRGCHSERSEESRLFAQSKPFDLSLP